MQANTIIKAALRKLLVIESGGTPSASQYADGLEVLNDMIKSWALVNNLIYENTREELSVSSGVQTITIGSTGTLVTTRPTEILSASLKAGNYEYPLEPIELFNYNGYNDKTEPLRPSKIYYRKTWPNGTINFESTLDQNYTLVLTSLKPLSQFVDGTTENSLPDPYELALKSNLVIHLADEMGAGNRVTPQMVAIATDSLEAIIGSSLRLNPSFIEIGESAYFNIETG